MKLKDGVKGISKEFKSIKTIDMTVKSRNYLEKSLWAAIGIVGATWIVYFVTDIVKY